MIGAGFKCDVCGKVKFIASDTPERVPLPIGWLHMYERPSKIEHTNAYMLCCSRECAVKAINPWPIIDSEIERLQTKIKDNLGVDDDPVLSASPKPAVDQNGTVSSESDHGIYVGKMVHSTDRLDPGESITIINDGDNYRKITTEPCDSAMNRQFLFVGSRKAWKRNKRTEIIQPGESLDLYNSGELPATVIIDS